MAESVAIVSKGSQANNNRNEMNNQTDDPIKMNGTLKSTTTSTVTPDSLANKLSHSNGAPSVMQINDIGFDLEQLFALSLKFFKSKLSPSGFDDKFQAFFQITKVKLSMPLTMIAIKLLHWAGKLNLVQQHPKRDLK